MPGSLEDLSAVTTSKARKEGPSTHQEGFLKTHRDRTATEGLDITLPASRYELFAATQKMENT